MSFLVGGANKTVRYKRVSVERGFTVYDLETLFSSLDPEQKDCLIEVIDKLLKDKTTVRNFAKSLKSVINHFRIMLLLRFRIKASDPIEN